jgi:hypothetical protein
MILLLTMDESINISMRKKEKAKLGTHSYVLIDCTKKKKKKIPSLFVVHNYIPKLIFKTDFYTEILRIKQYICKIVFL